MFQVFGKELWPGSSKVFRHPVVIDFIWIHLNQHSCAFEGLGLIELCMHLKLVFYFLHMRIRNSLNILFVCVLEQIFECY